MADTACTQALWQVVMGYNPAEFQESSNNPVENVCWNDAQKFIIKLNELTSNLNARLPTEAEWEYACRASTGTAYNVGDTLSTSLANYALVWEDNNFRSEFKGNDPQLTEVKTYPPNVWGLFEMHGNVWELYYDFYDEYSGESVIDPQGPMSGDHRVMQGGCWFGSDMGSRSASRGKCLPDQRNHDIGFRLVIDYLGVTKELSIWKEEKLYDQLLELRQAVAKKYDLAERADSYFFFLRIGSNYDRYPFIWESFRDMAGPLKIGSNPYTIVMVSDSKERLVPEVVKKDHPFPHYELKVSPMIPVSAIVNSWLELLIDANASHGYQGPFDWFLHGLQLNSDQISLKAKKFLRL